MKKTNHGDSTLFWMLFYCCFSAAIYLTCYFFTFYLLFAVRTLFHCGQLQWMAFLLFTSFKGGKK